MATSNQILSTVTGEQIIQEALEMLGVLGEGELATVDQQNSLLYTLNTMIANWQADGLNLFAVQKVYLFCETGRGEYQLNNDITNLSRAVTAYDETTLALPALETETVLTLVSTAGIEDGDIIGIYMDNTQFHWTGVISHDDNANTVTISAPMPSDAAAGNLVYTYDNTDRAKRPEKMLEMYVMQYNGTVNGRTRIPMWHIPRKEYWDLSNLDAKGVPIQAYYDPQTTLDATLYVWPTPSSSRDILQLNVQRQLDEVNILQDDLDYPAEWFLPLATNLAKIASTKHGTPQFDYYRVRELADEQYERAKGFDNEWETSVWFSPDDRGAWQN